MDELEQDCDQVAQDHIARYQAWEHRELARRLAEDVLQPKDLRHVQIRTQVADLVRVAGPYLEQEQFSDTTKAEQVATELLCLRDAMLTAYQCSEFDEAGGGVQVEQLAQKHGQIICQTAIKQRVVQLLSAEDESLHLVLASLAHAVRRWIPFDDHDTSSRKGVLSDHLQAEQDVADVLAKMISMVCEQAGGAA